MNAMAATIERLAAMEDIRTLKARYSLHCDRGYEADALAALFTKDAVWDGGARGRFEGRAAIRAFFERASGSFPFAAHLVTNPVIEVDGDRAHGSWRMLMPCIIKENGVEISAIQVAEYEETYLRQDGRWLIATLEVRRMRMTFPDTEWSAK